MSSPSVSLFTEGEADNKQTIKHMVCQMEIDAKEKNKLEKEVDNIIQMGEGAPFIQPSEESSLWSRDQ